jgi:hypothetical protein
MKIREIIREHISAEEQLGQSSLSVNMLPVLIQLQKRFENNEVKEPTMRMDAVLRAIQNTGDICTEHDLMDAWENDEAIKNVLSNVNAKYVVFKSKFDDNAGDESDEAPDNSEEVVDNMAKNAM